MRASLRARYGAVAPVPAAAMSAGGLAATMRAPAPAPAAAGAEVDDPVGCGDRVQAVLDEDDGVPGADELVGLA